MVPPAKARAFLRQDDLVQTFWSDDMTWYPAFVEEVRPNSIKLYYPIDKTDEYLKRDEMDEGSMRRVTFHFHFHFNFHLPPSTFHLPPSTFHLPLAFAMAFA